jgi:hypothetical protein
MLMPAEKQRAAKGAGRPDVPALQVNEIFKRFSENEDMRHKDGFIMPTRFFIGQKWISTADRQHTGEVIEISDDGHSGTVVITDGIDDQIIDQYSGTVALFAGKWQLTV